MKYTNYLIEGKHFKSEQFTPKNKIGKQVWVIILLPFTFFMLFLCCMLLPLTVSTDLARTAYSFELKAKRKLSRIGYMAYLKELKITDFLHRAA